MESWIVYSPGTKNILSMMASTESSKISRLSAGSGEDRSPSPIPSPQPSPFDGNDQSRPHTSISSLPGLPSLMESTGRRRRRSETQELRNKVELLGTKVANL